MKSKQKLMETKLMNNFNIIRRQIKKSTFRVEISELIFISVNMKRF